ncbi:hypothetical protein KJ652_07430 [Patescibacteria group bacterium]|nr:hypothetical protein [Patescibacteria group bacterium]
MTPIIPENNSAKQITSAQIVADCYRKLDELEIHTQTFGQHYIVSMQITAAQNRLKEALAEIQN